MSFDLVHTRTEDLDIFLEAPDGAMVELVTDGGDSGQSADVRLETLHRGYMRYANRDRLFVDGGLKVLQVHDAVAGLDESLRRWNGTDRPRLAGCV